jgi:hypothetical protein
VVLPVAAAAAVASAAARVAVLAVTVAAAVVVGAAVAVVIATSTATIDLAGAWLSPGRVEASRRRSGERDVAFLRSSARRDSAGPSRNCFAGVMDVARPRLGTPRGPY